MVAKDPATADLAMKQWNSYVDALRQDTSFQTPENASKLETLRQDGLNEIAKVQVKAYADKGQFGMASGLLDSGVHDKNIPPNEQSELHDYIKSQQRAQRADQDHAYLQQERAQKAKDESFSDNIIGQMQFNPKTGVLDVPPNLTAKILAEPGISAKAKVDTIAAANKVIQDSVKQDDPTTVKSLFAGLTPGSANPTTQTSALQMLGAGKITPQTYEQINNIVKGTDAGKVNALSFTQTLKVVKTQVSGEDQLPGVKDPKGEENYAKALPAISAAYQAGLAKGTPENELLDPDDKNWIGNAAKPFVRDPTTWYTDMATAGLGAEPSKPAPPVPPMAERVVGKTTYTNAAGIVGTWNGTGWEIKK